MRPKPVTKSKKETSKEKYLDIIITDIQLHVVKPRNPAPAGRAMVKALRKNSPGRFYKRDGLTAVKNGKAQLNIFNMDEIAELKEKARKENKKIRFFIPKNGLNVLAGKDLCEYIEAKRKKAFDKANR